MRGMIPPQYLDLVEAPMFAHMATVGPDGEPQSNPVWFLWDGTHILVSLTRGRQKYRNLHAESRTALSIMDAHDPYRYLEIRCTVDSVDKDPDGAFLRCLADRYGQPWPHAVEPDRVVLRFRPDHTTQQG